MPYIHGRRVSLEEWQRENGSSVQQFHTGPNGENPGEPVVLDEETGVPVQPAKKAGSKRSSKSAAKAAAAIATATGQELPDLTGLDATSDDADGGDPASVATDGAGE